MGGGPSPYGYQVEQVRVISGEKTSWRGKLAEHAVHAERVRRVLHWFCEGGYVGAAKKAEAQVPPWPPARYETKRGRSKKAQGWIESVRAIVRHALPTDDGRPSLYYQGIYEVRFGDETYRLPAPKLIDADLYARVARAQKELTIAARTTALITTGHVDCACGAHAMNNDSHGRGTYRTRCRACHRWSVPETDFARALWQLTLARLVQIRSADSGNNGASREAERREARAAVKHLEDEAGALWDAYRARELPEGVWRTRNAKVMSDSLLAQVELNRVESEAQAHEQRARAEQTLESRLDAVLEEMVRKGEPTLDKKRKLLADLLNGARVIVTPGETKDAPLTLTLPPYKSLPRLSLRIDQIPAELMDGTVRNAEVVVMIRSADEDLGGGAKYAIYQTLPLRSVLDGSGKGATPGVMLRRVRGERAQPATEEAKATVELLRATGAKLNAEFHARISQVALEGPQPKEDSLHAETTSAARARPRPARKR